VVTALAINVTIPETHRWTDTLGTPRRVSDLCGLLIEDSVEGPAPGMLPRAPDVTRRLLLTRSPQTRASTAANGSGTRPSSNASTNNAA